MKKQLLVLVYFFASLSGGWAQSASSSAINRCATVLDPAALQQSNPAAYQRWLAIEAQTQRYIQRQVSPQGDGTAQRVTDPQVTVTIPVVVHVLFNSNAQNITDNQIRTQIDVLNLDYRRLNFDRFQTPAEFANVAADVNIEFQLACVDPNGNPTTGIRRVFTNEANFTVSYNANNDIDEAATGVKFVAGAAPWPRDRYLNMWVCDLTGGDLGYATPPALSTPATDGVVITYDAFGSVGALQNGYQKGRTATHEVGHWLNLQHTFGTNNNLCDDDGVADTPLTQRPTTDCPSGQRFSCGGSTMYQNYMDYTLDACMNLFTNGQRDRMRALFVAGGARESFISTKIQQLAPQACSGPVTFSVAANVGAAVTYQWAVSGALSLASGQGTNQITTTQVGTGPATIQVSANGYCESRTVQIGSYPITGKYINDYQEQPLVASTYSQDPNFVTDGYVQISLDAIPGTTNTFTLGSGQSHSLYQTSNTTAVLYYNNNVNYADVYVANTGGTCGPVNTWFSFYKYNYSYAVYPNPTSDELTVEVQPATATKKETTTPKLSQDQPFAVDLYNSQGLKVMGQASTAGKAILNVRSLPGGLYNMRIAQGKEVKVEHIQITH